MRRLCQSLLDELDSGIGKSFGVALIGSFEDDRAPSELYSSTGQRQ
jgi:hypothetical protein